MITYPKWRWSGSPTPSEMLLICDKCGRADWTNKSVNEVRYCSNRHRMREGTSKEYKEALASLISDELPKIKEV